MNDRKGFGSNFGFLMAAVGSAVGLGNIWGFPNKMGANGGFPFLILYLALALCCGVIIMLGELALGRKTGHGAVGAYQSISKRFKWLGWLGIAAAALIIYYKQVSEGYEDQSRFGIMQKVGMTVGEIRTSVNSQILTVFFLPLAVSAVHMGFAFPMVNRVLQLFGLVNVRLFLAVTAGVFLVFALFYVIVYAVTSKAYISIISIKPARRAA